MFAFDDPELIGISSKSPILSCELFFYINSSDTALNAPHNSNGKKEHVKYHIMFTSFHFFSET